MTDKYLLMRNEKNQQPSQAKLHGLYKTMILDLD